MFKTKVNTVFRFLSSFIPFVEKISLVNGEFVSVKNKNFTNIFCSLNQT